MAAAKPRPPRAVGSNIASKPSEARCIVTRELLVSDWLSSEDKLHVLCNRARRAVAIQRFEVENSVRIPLRHARTEKGLFHLLRWEAHILDLAAQSSRENLGDPRIGKGFR